MRESQPEFMLLIDTESGHIAVIKTDFIGDRFDWKSIKQKSKRKNGV